MMLPDVDDVLASLADTVATGIAPHVQDEHAASLCRTVVQLLGSVRARVAAEGPALAEDNDDLRALLARLRDAVPAPVAEEVDAALAWSGDGSSPTVPSLQAEARVLRGALVACINAIPDREHPARAEIRAYLQRQLDRQRPWLIDAFTGPRR